MELIDAIKTVLEAIDNAEELIEAVDYTEAQWFDYLAVIERLQEEVINDFMNDPTFERD